MIITDTDIDKLFAFLKTVDTCLLHSLKCTFGDNKWPYKRNRDKCYVTYYKTPEDSQLNYEYTALEYTIAGKCMIDREHVESISWDCDKQAITILSKPNPSAKDNRNSDFHVILWEFEKSMPVRF